MQKTSQYDLMAILMLLVAVALAYFLIRPMIGNLKDLNTGLSAKAEEIQKTQDKLVAVKVLKGQFDASPDILNRLKVALPASLAMPDLIVQLETLVSRNSLDVASLQPDLTLGNGQAVSSLSLAVKGSYGNFVSFLGNLENNIRPLRVKTLAISGTPKDNASVVSANLVLNVFNPSQ